MTNEIIFEKINSKFDKIVSYRRHLHKNPELSYKEFNTAKFIRKKLDEMNISYKEMANTGTVAIIGRGDNCIALRADIDALPITEETDLEYKSQNEGIMHACGHDMHTSMLLGTAEVLKELENDINGTVKLIFQPAEEQLPGGALAMIEEGVLENPKPKMIFGQHIFPEANSGTISLSSGTVMAAADELFWTIKGSSCHAAQPQAGGDPIAAASNLVLFYHSMINKFRNPFDAGVLSVTAIEGGFANNIFPDHVKMKGTMRSFNQEWREDFHKLLMEKSNQLCELYNCECYLEIRKGYPPLINSEEAVSAVKQSANQLFSPENVINFEPKMWAEDFSYYSQKIPACFWFLGVKSPEMESMPPLHNSKINPQEEAMKNGIALFIKTVIDQLA